MDWHEARQRFPLPLFDSIRTPLAQLVEDTDWPGVARLNDCAAGLTNFRGQPIRFVSDEPAAGAARSHYEMRIAECGEIATRKNWHDFYNAMSWLAFPHAKGAISEMHARLLSERGEAEVRKRSTARDVLTLFDEGGIVVASPDASLLDLVRRFKWKTLFVERRADVDAHMRFFLFGHSMLEKALEPYVGVTAKAILLTVDDAFPASSHAVQMRHIDQLVAAWLMHENNLTSPRNFSPLPWLGVPGWWNENESPGFYDNARYFRAGRMRESANAKGSP